MTPRLTTLQPVTWLMQRQGTESLAHVLDGEIFVLEACLQLNDRMHVVRLHTGWNVANLQQMCGASRPPACAGNCSVASTPQHASGQHGDTCQNLRGGGGVRPPAGDPRAWPRPLLPERVFR